MSTIILGIESSCDDTSAAVITRRFYSQDYCTHNVYLRLNAAKVVITVVSITYYFIFLLAEQKINRLSER